MLGFYVLALTFALCCSAHTSGYGQCSGTGGWSVDCNWCECEYNTPVCTEKFCTGPPPPGPRCCGEVTWQEDCNTCHCEGGSAVCTEAFCGPDSTQSSEESNSAVCYLGPFQECCVPAGTTGHFRRRCNSCICDENLAGCTRIDCDGVPPKDYEHLPECNGQVRWRRDFHICDCVNGQAVCDWEDSDEDRM